MALALQAAVAGDAKPALDRYRTLTSAETRCARDPQSTDITVCGQRNADRFRAPLVMYDAGDPMWEAVGAERLLGRTDQCREKSVFLVGCGMAGVHVTAGSGRDGIELRPMAK